MPKTIVCKCLECKKIVKSWESCTSCGTPLCQECSDKQEELCSYCLIMRDRKLTLEKSGFTVSKC